MIILPTVPSELLRIAHADLIEIQNDPAFSVDMDYWVASIQWPENPLPVRCEACLAGAVMIKTLDLVPSGNKEYSPGHFPGNEDQLVAIEYFRTNSIRAAFSKLDNKAFNEVSPPRMPVLPDYETDPEGFTTTLLALVDRLEALGF